MSGWEKQDVTCKSCKSVFKQRWNTFNPCPKATHKEPGVPYHPKKYEHDAMQIYGMDQGGDWCSEYWQCCFNRNESAPGCESRQVNKPGGPHTPTSESLAKAKQLAAEEQQRQRNSAAGYGTLTDAEVADEQRKRNASAGYGKITDAEVEQQRQRNSAAGYGTLTDAEADEQRKSNARAAYGTLTNAEADAQRQRNSATGYGTLTDAEVAAQRKRNASASCGKITDAEADEQRKRNASALYGKITDAEVAAQRKRNASAGYGTLTDAEADVQRKRNASASYGKITDAEVEAQRKANATGTYGPITNAEVAAMLGKSSPADTLATLVGYFEAGELTLAAAVVANEKVKWAKPIQEQLDAILSNADTEKCLALAEHIKPVIEMMQKAYSKVNVKKLTKKKAKATRKTIVKRFDKVVSSMLLQFTKQYVEKLGSSGGAEALKARLQTLDDTSIDTQLYINTDKKLRKERGDAALRKAGVARAAAVKKAHPDAPRQPVSTVLEMIVSASEKEQAFKTAVIELGKASGAEVQLSDIKGSSLKGLLRLFEKALLKAVILGLDHVDFSLIYDLLRAMLVAPDTAVAAKAQTAVYDGTVLKPCRWKCRLEGKSVTGWRDELINVFLDGFIGEIQIVRSKMLVQRETMGGHDGYDESRSLRGLYEACTAKQQVKELTAKEQKALAKLLAKRKKAIAKKEQAIRKANAACVAVLAKVDPQIEAITGDRPGEVTFAELE
eukprot:gene18231-4720_t